MLRKRGMASEECPHAKSRRLLLPSSKLLNSFNFPAPKRIRLAVANSNESIALPVFVGGEEVCIFDSLSGFSHHICNGVAPTRVMSCFLMCCGRIRRFIDFHED